MKYAISTLLIICVLRLVFVYQKSSYYPSVDTYDSYNVTTNVDKSSNYPLTSFVNLFEPVEDSYIDKALESINGVLGDLSYYNGVIGEGDFWEQVGAVLQSFLVFPLRLLFQALAGLIYVISFLANFVSWLFVV